MKPQLWLLAGGNGAGKSTFYRCFLEPRGLPCINADVLAHALDPASTPEMAYAAARLAARLRDQALADGQSFAYETVFSHPSKIDVLGNARARGYEVILVCINLASTDLHAARVAQRVGEGGHGVPHAKIASRLPRTLRHLHAALPIADEVRLLDNSSREQPFRQLALLRRGQIVSREEALPDWARRVLDGS